MAVDLAPFAPIGLSVTVGPRDQLLVLASLADGAELADAQANDLGGPLPDAVATGLPVAVADVWNDPRWPQLTRQAMTARHPQQAATWERIQGVAVMPAGHDEHSMVALSCSLAGPADERTLYLLARYRQLLESAIAVAQATSREGSELVLRMLQSRAIIEQAKGAIMAASGRGPEQAWATLRTASQHHNLKLRDIATALVELLSNSPAEHPHGLPIPTIHPAAYPAATKLWKDLF